jgi:predicted ATPase
MIKGIGFENFKAFEECAYMDFKKLNVFLGPNSSGKSSYLKGLLTLQETMKSSEAEPAIHLTDRIGSFRNIVYGQKSDGKFSVTIKLGDVDSSNKLELRGLRNEFAHISSSFVLGGILVLLILLASKNKELDDENAVHEKEREQSLKYVTAFEDYSKNRVQKVTFIVTQPSPKKPNRIEKMTLILEHGDSYDIVQKGESYDVFFNNNLLEQAANWLTPYKFFFKFTDYNVFDSPKEDLRHTYAISLALYELEQCMKQFFDHMVHMEPFRNVPERSEMVANYNFGSVGARGENMLTNLISLFSTEQDDQKAELRDEINHWMREFQLADSIDVEENGNNYHSLIIKNKHTKIRTNIVDVGVGTSQLLPIIIESVISPQNSSLLIEEPETHIHPNAQAKLGELFASCSKKYQKRFFIETHSLYLVRQFQILVAKKELEPSDIGVYYFHQDENGTHIKDLRLSDNGQFEEEFPKGFFDVPFQLTKELMNFM